MINQQFIHCGFDVIIFRNPKWVIVHAIFKNITF